MTNICINSQYIYFGVINWHIPINVNFYIFIVKAAIFWTTYIK